MNRATATIRNLLLDTGANVLAMSAVAILVLTAMVGSAVDTSRAYRAQNRLQAACDAGVLAGRKAVTTNGFDSTAQSQANAFFNTNYDDPTEGTTGKSFTASASDATANTINGTATASMPMLLMQIFGKGSLTLSTNCSSTMGVGNADVTMVLDNTGSMADTLPGDSTSKIAGLRTAMTNFYSTVSTATQGTNARIRYALLPFSSAVNVGQILTNLNPAYVSNNYAVDSVVPYSVRSQTIQYGNWPASAPYISESFATTSPTLTSGSTYTSMLQCLEALPAETSSVISNTTGNAVSMSIGYWWSSITISGTRDDQVTRYTSYSCFYSTAGSTWRPYTWTNTKTASTYHWNAGSGSPSYSSLSTSLDHVEYRPMLRDASTYKTFSSVTTNTGNSSTNGYFYDGTTTYYTNINPANGSNITSTWAGCIEERDSIVTTNPAYNSGSNTITPSAATDLDIDTAPTSSDLTKWQVLWPEVQYYRQDSSGNIGLLTSNGSNPNAMGLVSCPAAAQAMQTMTASQMSTYANSLNPTGGTYLDVGMLWGARLSSPTGIWQSTINAAPANGGNVSRHIIFMTDGFMDTGSYIGGTYGMERDDRRVTTSGNKSDSDTNHSARLHAICDAIKGRGIRLWIIAFIASTDTPSSDLSYCASPSSMFTASSTSQLNSAFQTIAKQVGELRVTQ